MVQAATNGQGQVISFTLVSGGLGYAAGTAISLTSYADLSSGTLIGTPPVGKYLQVPSLNVPTTAPTIGANFVGGTTYYYVVTATGPTGETIASNEQSVVPAAGDTVALTWNAIAGATGYNVYRSTTSGFYGNALVTSITSGATTSFIDYGPVQTVSAPVMNIPIAVAGGNLANGLTYYYTVTATLPNGTESVISNVQSYTPNGGNDTAQLSWSVVTGATGYKIYRSIASGSFASPSLIAVISSGTTVTYDDSFLDGTLLLTGLTPGLSQFQLYFDPAGAAPVVGINETAASPYTGTAADTVTIANALDALKTVTLSMANSAQVTISTVNAVTGAITAVAAAPAAPGSGYAPFSVINLQVAGGGGSGAIVQATTNAAGQVTAFALLAGGLGYATTPTAATAPIATVNFVSPGQYTIAFDAGLAGTTTPIIASVVAGPGTAFVVPSAGSPPNDTAPAISSETGYLPPNTYYYLVTAVTGAGEVIASNEQAVTTSATDESIDLAWAPISGATSYRIYRSTTSGSYSNTLIAAVPSDTTTYTDNGGVGTFFQTEPSLATNGALAINTTYYYLITALTAAGQTIGSNQMSITTNAKDLTADLSWDSFAGATSYNVYRSTTPGDFVNALLATTGQTTFIDDGTFVPGVGSPFDSGANATFAPPTPTMIALQFGPQLVLSAPSLTSDHFSNLPAGTYYYEVTADLGSGQTILSNVENVTVKFHEDANLSWTPVLGAVDYNIYVSSNPANFTNSYETTVFPPTTSYVDNGSNYPPFFGSPTGITTVTPAIPYTGISSVDSQAMQNALQALGTIGNQNATVSANTADTAFTITFQGALSDAPQSLIVPEVNESSATANVSELIPGDGGSNIVYTVVFNGTGFAGNAQPLIIVPAILTTLTVNVSEVATGGIGTLVYTGSALQVDGDPNHTAPASACPSMSPPATTWL